MRRLISVLSLAAMWPVGASWAQLYAPNVAGVALGHLHTIVRDLEATKKFWTVMGGTAIRIDGIEVMKFPGVFIFLTKGSPSGGSFGSVGNHVEFHVPDVEESVAKAKAAGLTAEYTKSVFIDANVGWVYTPDDLKVELIADKSLTVPIAGPGLHLWVVPSAVTEMQAWYARLVGGTAIPAPANTRNVRVDGIPGVRLIIENSQDSRARTPRAVGLVHGTIPAADSSLVTSLANPPLPTKGRALDHIGFEITNLETFCKRLEASGVNLVEPFSRDRHASFGSAELIDPWGTSVELTEGLNRF